MLLVKLLDKPGALMQSNCPKREGGCEATAAREALPLSAAGVVARGRRRAALQIVKELIPPLRDAAWSFGAPGAIAGSDARRPFAADGDGGQGSGAHRDRRVRRVDRPGHPDLARARAGGPRPRRAARQLRLRDGGGPGHGHVPQPRREPRVARPSAAPAQARGRRRRRAVGRAPLARGEDARALDTGRVGQALRRAGDGAAAPGRSGACGPRAPRPPVGRPSSGPCRGRHRRRPLRVGGGAAGRAALGLGRVRGPAARCRSASARPSLSTAERGRRSRRGPSCRPRRRRGLELRADGFASAGRLLPCCAVS
eukprot:8505176-Pyramimonas_sp.AAC.1